MAAKVALLNELKLRHPELFTRFCSSGTSVVDPTEARLLFGDLQAGISQQGDAQWHTGNRSQNAFARILFQLVQNQVGIRGYGLRDSRFESTHEIRERLEPVRMFFSNLESELVSEIRDTASRESRVHRRILNQRRDAFKLDGVGFKDFDFLDRDDAGETIQLVKQAQRYFNQILHDIPKTSHIQETGISFQQLILESLNKVVDPPIGRDDLGSFVVLAGKTVGCL